MYDYSEITEYLLFWFERNARILPWRSNKNPYYVWVSEIMLQQTRVEAVKPYFEAFIMELPDIPSLAAVREDKLMKLWEGLGYYSRVRNLQKAAKIVTEQYQGELPADRDELLKLPGIGSYTAGAIASIAFGLPEPAVDGNVLRVMKRIAGSFDDITKDSVKRELEDDIRQIMPRGRTAEFTQSLMELGALVCVPNGKPLCEQCPVMHLCKAFHEGNERNIPVKPAKKSRRVEERTVYLLECHGKYALKKRDTKGLLAGMWELPNEYGKKQPMLPGCDVLELESLGEAKHIFSHVEWHMTGYLVRLRELQVGYEWHTAEEINESFALPAAFSAYRKYIIDKK